MTENNFLSAAGDDIYPSDSTGQHPPAAIEAIKSPGISDNSLPAQITQTTDLTIEANSVNGRKVNSPQNNAEQEFERLMNQTAENSDSEDNQKDTGKFSKSSRHQRSDTLHTQQNSGENYPDKPEGSVQSSITAEHDAHSPTDLIQPHANNGQPNTLQATSDAKRPDSRLESPLHPSNQPEAATEKEDKKHALELADKVSASKNILDSLTTTTVPEQAHLTSLTSLTQKQIRPEQTEQPAQTKTDKHHEVDATPLSKNTSFISSNAHQASSSGQQITDNCAKPIVTVTSIASSPLRSQSDNQQPVTEKNYIFIGYELKAAYWHWQ